MFVCVCLLVCVIGTSATHFHYVSVPTRRIQEYCKVCYGEDCFPIDREPCQYFTEVDGILENNEGAGNGSDVDEMIYQMMEKATFDAECTPLISMYTDCNKENICTGCKECTCSVGGQWNCMLKSQCGPEVKVEVDRQVLLSVVEALNKLSNSSRFKRSLDEQESLNGSKNMYQKISEWMYGIDVDIENQTKSYDKDMVNQTVLNNSFPKGQTLNSTEKSITNQPNNEDYLAFDYVLNSIAVDLSKNNRRKYLEEHNNTEFNYMDFEDTTTENDTKPIDIGDSVINDDKNNIKVVDIEDNTIKDDDKVVVDLLASARYEADSNTTEQANNLDPLDADIYNDVLEKLNINKRNLNENESKLVEDNDTNTYTVEELQNNVLKPLTNIINEKNKELQDLINVKESIQKFTKLDPKDDSNTTNSAISIYKLEITDDLSIESNILRNNRPKLEQLLKKLKRDIYEVVRDIILIKQLNIKVIPKELKVLFNAMRRYIIMEKSNKLNYTTRKSSNMTAAKIHFVQNITNIFKTIVQNISGVDKFDNLSPGAHKILSRVVKDHYIDDLAKLGITVDSPHYNLSNELQKVGSMWNSLGKNLETTSIHNRIYCLKLLHFNVMNDLNRMNNALNLINFAQSRRMVPIDDHLGNELINNITQGLISLNDKIKTVIKLQMKRPHNTIVIKKENRMKTKKQSLIMRLKNILRSSKADIKRLLKKKVPKEEIVKEIAKKRLHEISRRRMEELETTMRKWQSDLNIIPRDKRSAKNIKLKKRINRIIPKYLRGKVDPEIAKKEKKTKTTKPKKKQIHTTTQRVKKMPGNKTKNIL